MWVLPEEVVDARNPSLYSCLSRVQRKIQYHVFKIIITTIKKLHVSCSYLRIAHRLTEMTSAYHSRGFSGFLRKIPPMSPNPRRTPVGIVGLVWMFLHWQASPEGFVPAASKPGPSWPRMSSSCSQQPRGNGCLKEHPSSPGCAQESKHTSLLTCDPAEIVLGFLSHPGGLWDGGF